MEGRTLRNWRERRGMTTPELWAVAAGIYLGISLTCIINSMRNKDEAWRRAVQDEIEYTCAEIEEGNP